ncbi:hypothetical protein OOZ63_17190 [Paucibacter sp. PLA-PC-4]|uniref:hypothetical protein n=1 Tax=Paucibacter sp. PLA-PC-4 TaxID=2993655 RepID=UPI00224B869F|nr:hypothetical protein [Paucibacter sp. PLA-PC-4]MCX2863568.1 hypothetical protein [Paucibacter sp. PLA-PC-4]
MTILNPLPGETIALELSHQAFGASMALSQEWTRDTRTRFVKACIAVKSDGKNLARAVSELHDGCAREPSSRHVTLARRQA